MYKRSLQTILDNPPTESCMCVTQFSNVHYSSDVAFCIPARVDAVGAYFLIEMTDKEPERKDKGYSKVYGARNPGKNYGDLVMTEGVQPTLLATDYKSPPVIVFEYEGERD